MINTWRLGMKYLSGCLFMWQTLLFKYALVINVKENILVEILLFHFQGQRWEACPLCQAKTTDFQMGQT